MKLSIMNFKAQGNEQSEVPMPATWQAFRLRPKKYFQMKVIFTFYFVAITCALMAQTTKPYKLPNEMTKFFVGQWQGQGEFSNGKKIQADCSFAYSLDSAWFTLQYNDKAPGKYKSQSLWGVNSNTGEFMAYTFDNFQFNRKFDSNGWKNDKLILTNSDFYPGAGVVFQHFIFEKISDNTFKITYEASNDGIQWKMVDCLIFNKTK